MVNFLKKITEANFLPGKKTRGNNHYVYSSIFNSLMDKLIPIITGEKEVTVEKLKFEETDDVTASGGAAFITKRSGIITTETMTTSAGSAYNFRIYLRDINDNVISIPDSAMCILSIENYSGTGLPIVHSIDPQTNRFAVDIQNIAASAALNSTVKLQYFIINV